MLGADLDSAFRLARAQRNAGDAMGFHLRLIEKTGNEHVIAERHGAYVARPDPAGIEMRRAAAIRFSRSPTVCIAGTTTVRMG